jgi:glutamate 5-kinase
VVSTVELALTGQVFGDNDHLAALVASNLGADLLLLLTDVDGVYTAPPGSPDAERIPCFESTVSVRIGERSALGTGGMESKIRAARIAARSGVRVVIASGLLPDTVSRVLNDEDVGTVFPAEPGMNRRRQWIAFATSPSGSLRVNRGARDAVMDRQASLLAPGLLAVEGDFDKGAVVRLVWGGEEFARGVVGRGSADIAGLGHGARGVVVHRDQIAVLEGR